MPLFRTSFTAWPPTRLQVAGFDGPLELLLHLIGEGEIEITSVSLAAVADQYLAALRLLPAEAPRLDFLAEFLVVGAQLLVLKSRALLPREATRPDDEIVDEDTLAARLEEYRRYRAAAVQLREKHERGDRSYSRRVPPPLPDRARPPRLEPSEPYHLAAALQRLLAAHPLAPQPEPLPRVTVSERIDDVRRAVAERGRVTFLWLVRDCVTRADLIVTFLAILELYRAQVIEIQQDGLFGEIWLAAAVPASISAPQGVAGGA